MLDDEGAALADRLAGDGLAVEYVHLDVRDPAGWDGAGGPAAQRATAGSTRWSTTPGVAARERLPHVRLEAWQRTFDINVTGPLLGIQALVPLMPAGLVSIVNICSVAAMAGHAAAAYTASKWALRGLTRTASLELGARGIRVNAVMPGLVDTPLMAAASPAFTDAALAEIPLGRVGVPADIAPTIVFLRLRRLGVLQRRRDRHRRRPDRARLAQGHRRRDQADGAGVRLATRPPATERPSGRGRRGRRGVPAARRRSPSATSSRRGLERALEVGAQALAGGGRSPATR